MSGLCASAATLLAMSCTEVYVAAYCKVLIHQFYSWKEGKYLALVDGRKIEDDLFESLIQFYMKHSGLKRKEVREMLSHETWMNSKEVLKKGFAQKLYEG
jgi:ATP-dependent protease ClpP protease subunit